MRMKFVDALYIAELQQHCTSKLDEAIRLQDNVGTGRPSDGGQYDPRRL